ncbi:hypothetical protein BDN70DRAFT_920318, partial [Pholiota conissans]
MSSKSSAGVDITAVSVIIHRASRHGMSIGASVDSDESVNEMDGIMQDVMVSDIQLKGCAASGAFPTVWLEATGCHSCAFISLPAARYTTHEYLEKRRSFPLKHRPTSNVLSSLLVRRQFCSFKSASHDRIYFQFRVHPVQRALGAHDVSEPSGANNCVSRAAFKSVVQARVIVYIKGAVLGDGTLFRGPGGMEVRLALYAWGCANVHQLRSESPRFLRERHALASLRSVTFHVILELRQQRYGEEFQLFSEAEPDLGVSQDAFFRYSVSTWKVAAGAEELISSHGCGSSDIRQSLKIVNDAKPASHYSLSQFYLQTLCFRMSRRDFVHSENEGVSFLLLSSHLLSEALRFSSGLKLEAS